MSMTRKQREELNHICDCYMETDVRQLFNYATKVAEGQSEEAGPELKRAYYRRILDRLIDRLKEHRKEV